MIKNKRKNEMYQCIIAIKWILSWPIIDFCPEGNPCLIRLESFGETILTTGVALERDIVGSMPIQSQVIGVVVAEDHHHFDRGRLTVADSHVEFGSVTAAVVKALSSLGDFVCH